MKIEGGNTINSAADMVTRMKHNLRVEMARQEISPLELSLRAGIDRTTLYKYTSKYLSCGKIDVWLSISLALGHNGLDWLLHD